MYPMAGSPLVPRGAEKCGFAMKTESPPVAPATAFACDVCGARLDRAHLEFARDGSHCSFCGAQIVLSPAQRATPNGGSLDVGDALYDARMTRGETLEQAARFTRIQPTYLRALEADDASAFEPFPGMTYARYFLRDYAEHLGIDPRPLVRRFDSEVSTPMVERIGREPVLTHAPHPRRWALGALVLLVALLVGSALWARRAGDREPVVSLPTASGVSHHFATGPIGPRGSVDLSAALARHIWVTVRTTDAPSWIMASVDGSVAAEETLAPGEVRRWHADRTFALRLGNAGAVILTVDGQRIPTGGDGAIMDLSFALRRGAVVRL